MLPIPRLSNLVLFSCRGVTRPARGSKLTLLSKRGTVDGSNGRRISSVNAARDGPYACMVRSGKRCLRYEAQPARAACVNMNMNSEHGMVNCLWLGKLRYYY